MNITKLSTLTARKRQLNQLCTAAVEQQVEQNKAENNHLRKRRRYLAKQVLKHVSLWQHRSNRHWLHAVTLVFALWGFNALVTPNQAMAAPAFGNDNPLFGVVAGSDAMPAFADIDGDGDLDAFVGVYGGVIKYYRNDGTNLAPDFVADAAGNPLAVVAIAGYYSDAAPTFADIDGDGDLDVFVGQYYNEIEYYRNTEIDADVPGTGFVKDTANNPLALVPYVYGSSSSLTFADIDRDGDLDAFVGGKDGTVKYYRNTRIDAGADVGFVADAAGNPLTGFDVGAESTPNFADIDADGDLDAFIGQRNGSIKYYRNTRIDAGADVGFVADGEGNPLANFIPGRDSAPTFADLDGDGDLDAFVGTSIGTIIYYRNTEVDADVPGTGMVTDNLFAKHTVGTWASPSFTDINGDGVLDAFVGDSTGTVKYFRNEGTNQAPTFVADVGGNPLDGFDVGQVAAPTFEDIDGDGDLDAFIGEQDGTVKYYRNTEIDAGADVGFIADVDGNPLAAVSVGNRSIPTFADLDGDGDLDAFVGEWEGHINYFRNTEIDADVPGTGFVADNATDPLASLDIGVESAPTFADLDGDGDLDAFIGAGSSIKYFRNTEIDSMVQGTGFVADAANNPLAKMRIFMARPEFADIDGDGDLDVFVGGFAGSVKYYKNSDPVPTTVDDTLDAVAGVAAITGDVVANDQFKSDGPAAVDFSIVAFDATSTNGGTVVNNGDNTFTYTSPSDFQGSDSFTYTLDDGAGNTAVGKVAVTVSPASSDTGSGGGGGGGALNPWSLLLLPLVSWLRRKIS